MLFPYAFVYWFFVYGLIFWCLRRRGTTSIHPELGGDNIMGEALWKNSSTLG